MQTQPRLDPYRDERSDAELERDIAILQRHVTDARRERMDTVLAGRTRYIATVVEDIYQPHNASAVLRSCDAFGVQDVHILENRNRYHVNPGVELGTAQWLSLFRYPHEDATLSAYATLRERGYRIIATTPHTRDVTPDQLDLDAGPVAVVFGSEKEGLSPVAMEAADGYLRIPMRGFVESLNISVSAAVTMQRLSDRLQASSLHWQLAPRDRRIILARWLQRSVRQAGLILERERGPERGREPRA